MQPHYLSIRAKTPSNDEYARLERVLENERSAEPRGMTKFLLQHRSRYLVEYAPWPGAPNGINDFLHRLEDAGFTSKIVDL